ncbi:MAG: hypothetical protein ACRD36_11805, partial [Candidatus Acidiferrum sp.]
MWRKALSNFANGRLGELIGAFEQLTTSDPEDGAAWFYLGLARAWAGENAKAIEALDQHLRRENHAELATTSATLQEVLRSAVGLEDQCDYGDRLFLHQFRDPAAMDALLQDWARSRRLVPLETSQEGVFFGLVLETSSSGLITAGGPASDAGRLAGYLLVGGNTLRFNSPIKEAFERVKDEVRHRLALGLTELKEARGPVQFHDVVSEALLFPLTGDEEQNKKRVLQHFENYYEQTWTHKSRIALGGNTPVDALQYPLYRKKLLGVIRFIEDCSKNGLVSGYDFNRLRGKLSLLEQSAEETKPAEAKSEHAAPDIQALSAGELAALSVENLTASQLEQAFLAAQNLDNNELAVQFAKA